MAYALCFSESFFWGEDDQPSARPTSVFQALISMAPEDWHLMAHEVFGVEPDRLDADTVMARVLETNTCRNLDSPVEVFIDSEGFHTILVY